MNMALDFLAPANAAALKTLVEQAIATGETQNPYYETLCKHIVGAVGGPEMIWKLYQFALETTSAAERDAFLATFRDDVREMPED